MLNQRIEYRRANEKDIDILMNIRLEMYRIVNQIPEDYKFAKELIDFSNTYFMKGNQSTVIATIENKAIACESISYIDIMPTFWHST